MSYSNTNNNIDDWNFMNYTSSSNAAPLQEPVAFDDFQFSLGLDPDFAIPIPLDMPPPPVMTENELLSIEPIPAPVNHSVLNENDQKAFSQFLHQFYIDPNMQIDPHFSSIFEQSSSALPPPPPPPPVYHHHYNNEQEEYYRQSSILQSLDEQKKQYYQKDQNNDEKPVFLQQSNAVTAPYIKPRTPIKREEPPLELKQTNTGGGGGGGAIRRNKPHKELLTEEEKRNNHIASEQKRRGMIRTGFKDLTDIVPTLKNINNSKSTVLFKAVDYIKYLEKRNKNLRDKIKNLEVRVQVEGNNRPQQMSNSMNAALLQHKSQQKQLMELQEKLQMHSSEKKKKMDVDSNDSLIKTNTVSA